LNVSYTVFYLEWGDIAFARAWKVVKSMLPTPCFLIPDFHNLL